MNETTQLPYYRAAFYCRELRSIPVVRKFTRKALVEWECEKRMDDVLLCVTELATNALRHGVPPGRGFKVHIYLEGIENALRVELHDSGDGEVRPSDGMPGADDEGGRGLLLVAAPADEWGWGSGTPARSCGASSASRELLVRQGCLSFRPHGRTLFINRR